MGDKVQNTKFEFFFGDIWRNFVSPICQTNFHVFFVSEGPDKVEKTKKWIPVGGTIGVGAQLATYLPTTNMAFLPFNQDTNQSSTTSIALSSQIRCPLGSRIHGAGPIRD